MTSPSLSAMLQGSAYSRLSHKQREATPVEFARMLVKRSGAVAALWVRKDTVYRDMVECWDVERDARTYTGPGPIIAHPPCGPWGKLAWNCVHQSADDGIIAMGMVHRFGGVVEQPVGSSLFTKHGCPCGHIERVDQGDYGHIIRKPTLLFWHPPMSRHSVPAEDGTLAVDSTEEHPTGGVTAFDRYGNEVLDELDLAVIEVNRGELDLESVPSVKEREREARVAVQRSTSELLGKPIVMVKWRPQTALLTNTGEETEGYFCVGIDLTTQETFSVFIGGIALCRTLRRLDKPFRTTIGLRGRTLVFE